MEISAALTADLQSLTDALDEPGADMEGLLRGLANAARLAVPSYLGMIITLVFGEFPISLTVMDESPPARIAASMLVPLPALSDAQEGSAIVLYAANPGAFVDLAADLSLTLGASCRPLTLDGHLKPPVDTPVLTGLEHLSQVNQVLGVLIGDGRSPADADSELRRLARVGGMSLDAAARDVIRTASWRHPTNPYGQELIED